MTSPAEVPVPQRRWAESASRHARTQSDERLLFRVVRNERDPQDPFRHLRFLVISGTDDAAQSAVSAAPVVMQATAVQGRRCRECAMGAFRECGAADIQAVQHRRSVADELAPGG
jgi:hypothetical protein